MFILPSLPIKTPAQPKPQSGLLLCLLLPLLLALSGCATLNKSECLKGDWAAIGYNDAITGLHSHNELQQHYKACAKHKVRPNNKVYFSGYQRGLSQFCTQKTGLQYGANSSEYYGICPKPLEQRFLTGYLTGLDLAIESIRDDVDDLRHERRKKQRRLEAVQGRREHSKIIKKLRKHLDGLDSQISSRRDDRRRLRRWQATWATQLN